MITEPIKLDPVDINSISLNPNRFATISPLKSSLIGSIPTLIGGGLSALSQYITNQQNYKRQLDMYYENREYNSPKSQMERYREAGLNPNLIYGQSNTSQAMNVGTSISPDFGFIGQAGQSAISNYQSQESANVTNALTRTQFALNRINMEFLPQEKQAALVQLQEIVNQAIITTDIVSLEEKLKTYEHDLAKLGYEKAERESDSGISQDLSPEARAIMSVIGAIYSWITGNSSKELFNKIW